MKYLKKCYDVHGHWPTIFDDSHILSLSSGRFADKEVKSDLLGAKKVGVQCLEEFVANHIIQKSVAFYDPIKKTKLKTFSSMQAKETVKVKQNEISIKTDRKRFHACWLYRESVILIYERCCSTCLDQWHGLWQMEMTRYKKH